MKKRLYFITTLFLSAALLSLSSCLKDSRYVNFGGGTPVVEFNLGGQSYFGADAITSTADTITQQFAVSVASTTIPKTATTVQLAVDNSIVTSYDAANSAVTYVAFPTGTYSLSTTSVNIPAGQRVAIVTLTIYKNKLDPTLSYMLPVKIAGTSGGYTISGNMGIHYYHIIGNDFAGDYKWQFTRTPAGGNFTYADGNTTTFVPDTHTQFEVTGGYYTATLRYVVSYTETGSYPNATYSGFQISINPDDVKTMANAGISITTAPSIVGYDPTGPPLHYSDVLTLFQNGFTYQVLGGSGARTNLDQYEK